MQHIKTAAVRILKMKRHATVDMICIPFGKCTINKLSTLVTDPDDVASGCGCYCCTNSWHIAPVVPFCL